MSTYSLLTDTFQISGNNFDVIQSGTVIASYDLTAQKISIDFSSPNSVDINVTSSSPSYNFSFDLNLFSLSSISSSSGGEICIIGTTDTIDPVTCTAGVRTTSFIFAIDQPITMQISSTFNLLIISSNNSIMKIR